MEERKAYASIGCFKKYDLEMDLRKDKNIRPFKRSRNKALKLMGNAVHAKSPPELASILYESGNEYLNSFMDGRMFYNSLDLVPGVFDSEYAMSVREGIYRLSILKEFKDMGFISRDLADKTAKGIIEEIKVK
jgi:hypothetical protein